MLVHGKRNSNQVFHGRQTILGENFTGRPRTPPLLARIFFDSNAGARSVCGS